MRTDSALPRRLLSAALFLPLLAWLIRTGEIPYLAYCIVLLGFAVLEFFRLGREPLPLLHAAVGLTATLLGPLSVLGIWFIPGTRAGSLVSLGAVLAAVVVALLWDAVRGEAAGSVQRAGRLALGCLYVGGLGGYLISLRGPVGGATAVLDGLAPAPHGPGWAAVALAYTLTWTNDTSAYALGLLAGRTPLSPISPGKTREGALGGLLVTIGVGIALGTLAFPWLGGVRGAALGAVVSLAAQAGDLLESMWKRDLGSKDSARLIPGHGGVLDRFDSLLLAAPVVYYFLRWSSLI